MTTRLAMAVALLLLLLAQAWGLVSVWRDDPLRNLAVKGKKEIRVSLPVGKMSLQPTVSGEAPDLNAGYIFNAERNLAGGGGRNSQAQNAANVSIDKIHYSGAIITATNTRALLSYALGGPLDPAGGGGDGAQKQGFLRVAIGDVVNGYRVTEILPEKIIFSRDGQKITKLLYDKAKVRAQEPTPLSSREQIRQAPAVSPQAPAAKVAEQPQRTYTPRKQLQPPPSDEALRKKPLRKRPEPPPL